MSQRWRGAASQVGSSAGRQQADPLQTTARRSPHADSFFLRSLRSFAAIPSCAPRPPVNGSIVYNTDAGRRYDTGDDQIESAGSVTLIFEVAIAQLA